MKTKNKILSAVLAVGIAVGMTSMQPVQSFAATDATPVKEIDKVVAKRDVTKKKFKTGEVVIPFEFDDIYYTGFGKSGLCHVVKEGTHQYINKKGEILFDSSIISQNEKFHRIRENDKYGVVDNNGNVVISPIYDDVDYSEGLFAVKQDDK